jgi:Reverse transcriptase (RNA-dependent DNA polymerase)
MESYEEEYYGLVAHDTFTVIDSTEYKALRDQTGRQAIPSMAVLTIKSDGQGDPVCAKSRIVVLGNQESTSWTKSDCFAPVISTLVIRLMAALAVRHKTVLKQGDCKNAFCHTKLPENEVTIIHPPANCPISKPNTYWKLNKTLYGLQCSPQHWFNTLSKYFRKIGLRSTSHGSCLFVSTPVPGKAPIYVALFVDDFVYFSPDPDVKHHFEEALASKVKVDFMGQVDYFLGILFDWT